MPMTKRRKLDGQIRSGVNKEDTCGESLKSLDTRSSSPVTKNEESTLIEADEAAITFKDLVSNSI